MKKRLILLLPFVIFLLFIGCSISDNKPIQYDDLDYIKSKIRKDKTVINKSDENGNTFLHKAARNGDIDTVKYLVSQGADISVKNDYGQTPLQLAVIQSEFKIVEYLVSQSAKLDSKDNDGETPLHRASDYGYTKIVKFLVSHGAHVNVLDNYGNSPLHFAVDKVWLDIIKYLVSHGADVNAVDDLGNTPLHNIVNSQWSWSKEKLEIVKFLVSQGSDINKADQHGMTALDLSRVKEFKAIEAFLSSQIQIAKQNETQLILSKKVEEKEQDKDKSPPEIIITSHDISRGIKVVESKKEIRITGRAVDESRIVEVVVNGKEATVDSFGNFEANAYLSIGENKIIISAIDLYENRSYKTFSIIREAKEASTDTKVEKSSAERYYALIIGNNNYQHIRNLETARKDAEAVGHILATQYGFKTTLLLDATRNDIVGAINQYRKTLTAEDQLLIYYAGHGEFNKDTGKAYWLATDAKSDEDTNWIIVDRITSNIKIIPSKHILIVSDSCYSGTFTRAGGADLSTTIKRNRYLKKMQSKKSRTLLASGGNEPVSDIGGEGHSVFATAFLSGLKSTEYEKFTAEELYYRHIKEMVAGGSDQTPEYNIIRNSGHEGGDFVFRRID
jgi:ankyrin repeat protein